ncbi:MAG: Urea carboxylase-related amino acid permease, partial [uncultured Nocardioidaceae bacterium]
VQPAGPRGRRPQRPQPQARVHVVVGVRLRVRVHLADRGALRDLRPGLQHRRPVVLVELPHRLRRPAARGVRLRRAGVAVADRGLALPVVAAAARRGLRLGRRLGLHVDAGRGHVGGGDLRRGLPRQRPRPGAQRERTGGACLGDPRARDAGERRGPGGAAGPHDQQHRRGGGRQPRAGRLAAAVPPGELALGARGRFQHRGLPGGVRPVPRGDGVRGLFVRRLRERRVDRRGGPRAPEEPAEGCDLLDHVHRADRHVLGAVDHPGDPRGDRRHERRPGLRHPGVPARPGGGEVRRGPVHHRLPRQLPGAADLRLPTDLVLRPRRRAARVDHAGQADEGPAAAGVRAAGGQHHRHAHHRAQPAGTRHLHPAAQLHLRRVLPRLPVPARRLPRGPQSRPVAAGALHARALERGGLGGGRAVGDVPVLQHRLAARLLPRLPVPQLVGRARGGRARRGRRGDLPVGAPPHHDLPG